MNDRCLFCSSGSLEHLRRYRTKSQEGELLFKDVSLARCAKCGLIQVVPRPEPETLEKYYRRDYRRDGYGGANVADLSNFPYDNLFYLNRGKSITELLKKFLIERSVDASHILDIGAGYGHILYFLGLELPGAARYAIEFSEPCVRHLRSQNIRVFTESIEKVLTESEEGFDVIILSHVLEHLLDPQTILTLARSRLKHNGILYVEVPNIPPESVLRYPDHIWAPRHDEPHISFFSEPALQMTLERAGFESLFSSTCGPHYRYISRFRYSLPPLRSTLESFMPAAFFHFLRRQKFTKSIRVKEREESFFEYGGADRIWIRSLWKPC